MTKKKIAIFVILGLLITFLGFRFFGNKQPKPQYQTVKAEKGTLIQTVTASGQVSAANNTSVTTQASGVVSNVFVKNDQTVKTGDKIAELELDLDGKLRASQALASYQGAKNTLESAKATFYSLRSTMLTDWKTYMDVAQSSSYQNADGSPKTDQRQLPQFVSGSDDWLFAEAKYKNQQAVVNQAQTSVNSGWLNYQQASPVIYAPISGTVTGLSLQKGTVLLAQSNSSGSASSQKIASIKTNAAIQLKVNLTEIDVIKVKIGNKATVIFDALPGKTYTGEIISIDTIGAVSSGVTVYPAVIGLDAEVPGVLPNMAVNAKIITNILDNMVLVPSAAVQAANGQSTVRILKNGQASQVPVEVGGSNDTQTAIISGINEGDIVITGVISVKTPNSQTGSSSPFSALGGNSRGLGGGGFGGGARN